jgi:DNA polymerase-4
LQTLTNYFGKAGKYYYEVSRGIDNRSVNPNRIRKSIGAENTFSESLATHDELKEKMYPIIEKVWERYQKAKAKAHTQTLKVKYDDFTQITRSKTTDNIIKDKIAFEQAIDALIDQVELEQKVRLIGCSLSNFELEEETEKTKQEQQLTLRF